MCDQGKGGRVVMNLTQGTSKTTQDPQNTPKKPLLAFPPNAKKNAKKTLRTPSMSRGISRGSTHGVLVTHQKVHCQGKALSLESLFFCTFSFSPELDVMHRCCNLTNAQHLR